MYDNITIVESPDSLERFTQGGNVLYKLGVGRFRSPGHPAGNQQLHSQMPFFRAASTQLRFNVYRNTVYMGQYALVDYCKKVSFEGFTYFLFTLHRRAALEKIDTEVVVV